MNSPQLPILSRAEKLKAVLLPALERWHSGLPTTDLEAGAVVRYERYFERTVTPRRIRQLVQTIIKRDAGQCNWNDRRLYISTAAGLELDAADTVASVVEGFRERSNPSPMERAELWKECWGFYKDAIEDGVRPQTVKAALIKSLIQLAPWIAESSIKPRDAVRKALQRMFKKLAHSSNLTELTLAAADGRRLRRGPRAPEIPQADRDKIAGHALVNNGGRVRQAGRELAAMGDASGLTAETRDLISRGSSKYYLNERLCREIIPEVRMAQPFLLGTRAVNDTTPTVERCYDDLAAMDVISADDFTMPVYFWFEGESGPKITRGQTLLFNDSRSFRVISFVLVLADHYSAADIHKGMVGVCFHHGIPKVWYFEYGIWKKAHLVTQTPLGWESRSARSEPEVKNGWEAKGVKFLHATVPQAKIAEGVGAYLQNRMERYPGYSGRDERVDCPEETKKAKLAVAAGDHPSKYFMSADDWNAELHRLIEGYNSERQEGYVLRGLSPNQAFSEFWPHSNPPMRPDASNWHLVAHYVSERSVDKRGVIAFRLGATTYRYFGEQLIPGTTVKTWFTPDNPEFLGVTDLNDRNPVLIERSNPVPYLAKPGDELLATELARKKQTMRARKARFNVLKAAGQSFRQNVISRHVAATAEVMAAQRIEANTAASEENQRQSRIFGLCREAGVDPVTLRDFGPEAEESLRRRIKQRKEAW